MKAIKLILCSTIFAFLAWAQPEKHWPAWRGPNADGSAVAGSYPAKWSESKNLIWKAALPGKGCSTPVVWDEHILLTCPAKGQDAVLAFDWDGNKLWQTEVGPERKGKHRNGSGSNPSLVTDGKHAYALFKSGHFAALDFEGKTLWKKDLTKYGRDTLYWDFGTSPVLTEKHVIVALMRQNNSWLLAFDQISGEVVWKVERNYKTPPECDHSYATPIIIRHKGKEAILVWGAERLTAHSAKDGSMLWSAAGFNPQAKKNWVVVGSHVVAGDVAVVPYGRGSHLTGIRLGGKGDVTDSHRLWTRKDTGSFVPTPASSKGKVFILRDRGEVHCIDPKTGKSHWEDAFPRGSSSYYSSPTLAGGKLYAAREDGVIFVADVSNGFRYLDQNDMGERIIASPVPVANRLLIRGENHLFCLGE
ncbi:MAG: PQQ-binding-like beta-propeller repeat protein [Opitutales bacterium]